MEPDANKKRRETIRLSQRLADGVSYSVMRSFKGNGIHSSILVEHLFLYENSDGKLS